MTDRDELEDALVAHYRADGLHCACGWKGDSRNTNHARHQAEQILARWRLVPVSEGVVSVHLEESGAGLMVKGGALCECGAGFDEEAKVRAKPGAVHKHASCLYCGCAPGNRHDWQQPHPRMVWMQS